MKAPLIEINGSDYMVKSVAKATELAKLLSELVPLEMKHSATYHEVWYEESDRCQMDIKLKIAVEIRKKPKRLELPAPKRGSVLCVCGRSTVSRGESCPSCDMPFHAILEASQA
jgi:hypothetical protein